MGEKFSTTGELILVGSWVVGMALGYLLMHATGIGGIVGGIVQVGGLGIAAVLLARPVARKYPKR